MRHFVQRPIDPLSQKRMDDALARMIAKDFQPYSIVEDAGFRSFCKELNPSYTLPSRKTLSTKIIPELYQRSFQKVMDSVDKAEKICLTTDCWTSRTTTSLMAVTCHFVNEDFEMVSYLLDCLMLTQSHTAEYLKQKLQQVATDWNIEDKIAACVTDGAANIVKALAKKKDGGLGWPHAICFAHTLNLIVQNGIGAVRPTVDKVKAIVQYFHRSTKASDKLKEQQKSSGKEELRLKQECPTRWNSMLFMLKRFIEMKEPVIITTMALLGSELPMPSPAEWEDMQTICDILKHYEDVTKELSAERYVFINTKYYCIVMF